jgi:phage gp45-like
MMPDYTIRAKNPTATILMTPDGRVETSADTQITLSSPSIILEASSIKFRGKGGGRAHATFQGDLEQDGWHTSTGDQVAGSISQIGHTHTGCQGGSTGSPS